MIQSRSACCRTFWGLAICLVCVAGGCKQYLFEPPVGIAGDFSIIRADAGATILKIDDKSVKSGETINHGDQFVRVYAGRHQLTVYVANEASTGRWDVPIDAQPGHEYRIAPATSTAQSLRVVDQSTGQIVFGPGAVAPAPAPPAARPPPGTPR